MHKERLLRLAVLLEHIARLIDGEDIFAGEDESYLSERYEIVKRLYEEREAALKAAERELEVNNNPARQNIECGDLVQDIITPFKGIVTAVQHWSTGVAKATVAPQELYKGRPIPAEELDFEVLTILEKGKVPATVAPYNGPITFGTKVRDKNSGYTGFVRSKRVSISGCTQLGVYPQELRTDSLLGEIRPTDGYLFLSSELEVVEPSTTTQAEERELAASGTGPTPLAKSTRR